MVHSRYGSANECLIDNQIKMIITNESTYIYIFIGIYYTKEYSSVDSVFWNWKIMNIYFCGF